MRLVQIRPCTPAERRNRKGVEVGTGAAGADQTAYPSRRVSKSERAGRDTRHWLGVGQTVARSQQGAAMAIDFTLTPELEDIRARVRDFIDEAVKPAENRIVGPRRCRAADW